MLTPDDPQYGTFRIVAPAYWEADMFGGGELVVSFTMERKVSWLRRLQWRVLFGTKWQYIDPKKGKK